MLRAFVGPPVTSAVVVLIPPSGPLIDRGADTNAPCPTAALVAIGLPGLGLSGALDSSFDGNPVPDDPCPRPAAGSIVSAPADLFSCDGALNVEFDYFTSTDAAGNTLYCFRTPDGKEAPTLHLRPGDVLNLTLHDSIPPPPGNSNWPTIATPTAICGAARPNASSVSLHYHGTTPRPPATPTASSTPSSIPGRASAIN